VNFGPGHEFLWVRKGLPGLVSQIFDNDGKEFTHSTRLPILRKESLLSSDRGRLIVSKKRCANERVKSQRAVSGIQDNFLLAGSGASIFCACCSGISTHPRISQSVGGC